LAPKVFTALADTLEYAKEWSGKGDHYLDDFITIGPPGSDEHQCNLDIMLDACCSLGVPFSKEKLEGSSSCIAFLSIEFDTRSGVLQLSVETLARIRQTLKNSGKNSGCITEGN